MRVLITGSRHWHCPDLVEDIVHRLIGRYGTGIVVVHGGAAGIDAPFSCACETLGVETEVHLADWYRLGKKAGPIRNPTIT